MQAAEKKQLRLAGLLFGLAILFFVLFSSPEREALEYFYDESERKLFTTPIGSIPPIKGINDDQFDGVRAIVIAPKGRCGDESVRRIAYLEKWSPRLKQQIEAAEWAKAAGRPPPKLLNRYEKKLNQFVRRPDAPPDAPQWYNMRTPEAAKIMAVQGKIHDICTPNR